MRCLMTNIGPRGAFVDRAERNNFVPEYLRHKLQEMNEYLPLLKRYAKNLNHPGVA